MKAAGASVGGFAALLAQYKRTGDRKRDERERSGAGELPWVDFDDPAVDPANAKQQIVAAGVPRVRSSRRREPRRALYVSVDGEEPPRKMRKADSRPTLDDVLEDYAPRSGYSPVATPSGDAASDGEDEDGSAAFLHNKYDGQLDGLDSDPESDGAGDDGSSSADLKGSPARISATAASVCSPSSALPAMRGMPPVPPWSGIAPVRPIPGVYPVRPVPRIRPGRSLPGIPLAPPVRGLRVPPVFGVPSARPVAPVPVGPALGILGAPACTRPVLHATESEIDIQHKGRAAAALSRGDTTAAETSVVTAAADRGCADPPSSIVEHARPTSSAVVSASCAAPAKSAIRVTCGENSGGGLSVYSAGLLVRAEGDGWRRISRSSIVIVRSANEDSDPRVTTTDPRLRAFR